MVSSEVRQVKEGYRGYRDGENKSWFFFFGKLDGGVAVLHPKTRFLLGSNDGVGFKLSRLWVVPKRSPPP